MTDSEHIAAIDAAMSALARAALAANADGLWVRFHVDPHMAHHLDWQVARVARGKIMTKGSEPLKAPDRAAAAIDSITAP